LKQDLESGSELSKLGSSLFNGMDGIDDFSGQGIGVESGDVMGEQVLALQIRKFRTASRTVKAIRATVWRVKAIA
jgi:hypothetical protein